MDPRRDRGRRNLSDETPALSVVIPVYNEGENVVPTLRGVITGTWPSMESIEAKTKADLLQLWDAATNEINVLWPTIPPQRFQEVDKAFGQWEMPIYALLLYVIDNEIHHRGQGYVYLRALGIEPPPFYDRT